MPTKTFDEATGRFRVEFRLPAEANASQAWLAGEFNGWSTDACPLAREDDGSLATVVELDPGRSYRFRYYLGDGAWENDWAADAYVGNEHGGSDSVVTLPEAGPPPPVKKAAPKKAAGAKKAAKKKAAGEKKAAGVKKAAKKKAAPPPE